MFLLLFVVVFLFCSWWRSTKSVKQTNKTRFYGSFYSGTLLLLLLFSLWLVSIRWNSLRFSVNKWINPKKNIHFSTWIDPARYTGRVIFFCPLWYVFKPKQNRYDSRIVKQYLFTSFDVSLNYLLEMWRTRTSFCHKLFVTVNHLFKWLFREPLLLWTLSSSSSFFYKRIIYDQFQNSIFRSTIKNIGKSNVQLLLNIYFRVLFLSFCCWFDLLAFNEIKSYCKPHQCFVLF